MNGSLVSSKIVEPYASALMSLAKEHGDVETLGRDIRALLSLFQESADLRSFVLNPLLDAQDKKAVLRKLAGEDARSYFLNFLLLLVDRRRIFCLEEVCQQYLTLQRQLNNTVLAEVSSATDLSDSQREAIANKVKSMTGATVVELDTKIDPNLIGGVVIKVGSQVLDASIKGQLRRIGISLLGAN